MLSPNFVQCGTIAHISTTHTYTHTHIHTYACTPFRLWNQLPPLAPKKNTRALVELNLVSFFWLLSPFLSLCSYSLSTSIICMCSWGLLFFLKLQDATLFVDECLEKLITHGNSHPPMSVISWCAGVSASLSLQWKYVLGAPIPRVSQQSYTSVALYPLW